VGWRGRKWRLRWPQLNAQPQPNLDETSSTTSHEVPAPELDQHDANSRIGIVYSTSGRNHHEMPGRRYDFEFRMIGMDLAMSLDGSG
jgi:hypothetical protein